MSNKPDLNNPDATSMVLDLADYHDVMKTWDDKSDMGWFAGILTEVAELSSSLAGEHEHPPEFEAAQIAACCINYLRWRKRQAK